MAELGGFFAVSYIAKSVFTEAWENIWNAKWTEAFGTVAYTVPSPVGHLACEGGISVDKPSFDFIGAANVVRLHLSASARLDLQLDGISVGGVFVQSVADLDVPVVITQNEASQKATLDISQFSFSPGQLHFTWYRGPTDNRATTAVLSDAFRMQITHEVRQRAERYLTFSLPTDRIFLAELAALSAGGPGSVIVVPFTKIGGVKIFDEWVAIGVDDTNQVDTHGNLAAIGLPPPLAPGARNSNIILVIDHRFLQTYLDLNAKFALILGLATRPNIHPAGDPVIELSNNAAILSSVGTVDAPDPFPGTMPYTAAITVKPYNTGGGMVYASVSPKVRVDAPWYLDVIGGIADFFGADVFAKLRRANQAFAATLFKSQYSMDVPGIPGLRAGINLDTFVLDPQLVAIFISGAVRVPSMAKAPPKFAAIFDPPSVHVRNRYLQLTIPEYWAPLLYADPTYRLTYRIRRGSNGAIVKEGSAWSGTPTIGEAVDMWAPENYLETSYASEVIVERPPGNQLARVSQDKITVIDLFDRSHPYARWHRQHWWYEKRNPLLMANPVVNPMEPHNKVRMSAIHKTNIQERCKFADEGTNTHPERYTVQALDALPPAEDPAFSSRLCRYCFGSDNP